MNAFDNYVILLLENLLLFKQNGVKKYIYITCNSTKATIEGSARIWSYEDIVEAPKEGAGAEVS